MRPAAVLAGWLTLVGGQPASELLGLQAISLKVVTLEGRPVRLTVAPPADPTNVTIFWPYGAATGVPAWAGPGSAIAIDPVSLSRGCDGATYICNSMLYVCSPPAAGPCTAAKPTRTFTCETPWLSASCLDPAGRWITDNELVGASTVEWAPDGRWIALRDPPNLTHSVIFCWFVAFILFALMTNVIVRDLTRIDIAATAAGGLALTQIIAPFTPSAIYAAPPGIEWAVHILTGLVAGITVGACLYAPGRTTSEVGCLAALSVNYPEHIVGRQPAILIQVVCGLLICALVGARREPLTFPAAGWAVLVLLYPALTDALISINITELLLSSAIVGSAVVALAGGTV